MRLLYLGAALLSCSNGAVGSDEQSFRKTADLPLLCDPNKATISFQGLLMGVSMGLGKFSLEWDDAKLEYELDQGSVSCHDPSYDVFLVPAPNGNVPFDFTPYEIPDLIDLVDASDDMMHLTTDDLFLDINDLEPDMVYSVLVTSHSEHSLYSNNREGVNLKVAGCNCAMEPGVNFIGAYDPTTDDMVIDYDSLTSTLIIETDDVLPEELIAVTDTDHLGVITSTPYDENFLFKVEAVGQATETRVELTVIEASLIDLFQELDLDIAERIEKESDAPDGNESRALATKTLFDETFQVDKTKNVGPLTVRGRVVLRAYLKVSVSISFKFTWYGKPKLKRAEAKATVGGSLEALQSLAYNAATKHSAPLTINLWKGGRARKIFWIGIVPVYVSYRPRVDLTGHVSVKLSAGAKIELTQTGSISVTVGVSKSRGWYSDSDKSFSQEVDTNLGGDLDATVKVGAAFWLDIDVYGVIGMDIGLYGGLGIEAEGGRNNDPLFRAQPYYLDEFDVFAFLELPVRGTSIMGDKNFGNLFALKFPLLELPEVQIERVAFDTCKNSDAIVLRLKAVQKKYDLPIKNRIQGPHEWIVQHYPNNDYSRSFEYFEVSGEKTIDGMQWRLPRSAISEIDFFQTPIAGFHFRTTPKFPGLGRSIIESDLIRTLFDNDLKFDCCDNSDCVKKFGTSAYLCGSDNLCFLAPTPAPTPFPTPAPTPYPTPYPTPRPTPSPTPRPTKRPTPRPSPLPTSPTAKPNTPVPSMTVRPTYPTPTAAPFVETPTAAPYIETPTAAPFVETPTAAPYSEKPTAELSEATIYEGEWGEWQDEWQGDESVGYYICGAAVRFDESQGTGDDTAANGLRLTYCYLNDWNAQVSDVVIHPGERGTWSATIMCPVDHYVDGAQVRFEDKQGVGGDDTALNGLKICCRTNSKPAITSWVTVHVGSWGEWKKQVTRDNMFAKQAKVRFESPVGFLDDTAWNGLKLRFERPFLTPSPTSDIADLIEPTLAPAPKPTPPSPGPILDFNMLPNGMPLEQESIKGDEWLEHYGMRVVSHPGPLQIVNSAAYSGEYGAPNELCDGGGTGIGSGGEPGMSGQNCEAQGNILLIGEGVSGTIIFDFLKPFKSVSWMKLINIDQDVTVSIVSLLPENTAFDTLDIDVPSLGVNSVVTVPIYADHVVQIQVIMAGAGAVAALSFDDPSLATTRVGSCEDVTIDFDTMPGAELLEPGLYVSDEWVDYGMLVSGSDGKKVRLFDSSNPSAADYDLGSPNMRCSPSGPGQGEGGEPDMDGENCEPLGNVLVIQQEGNGTKDEPNDDRRGGAIHFDFTSVAVLEIGLLDIEGDEGAAISIMTSDGSEETVNVTGMGDNSVQTVSINVEDVLRLSVNLAGSGAITFIHICS